MNSTRQKVFVTIIPVSAVVLLGIILFAWLGRRPYEKMKLYTFYTPSHEQLLNNWFLPSIKKYDDYELIVELHEQKCAEGKFMEAGWMETMHHKVDLIIRAIKENWNKIFVHADVDIQFFGPTQQIIMESMYDKDMMFQLDTPYGMPCAGFFACRANEKTLRLWQEIRRLLLDPRNKKNDQLLLLDFIKVRNPFNIKWGFFPADKFVGGGTYTGTVWQPGQRLIIPQGVLMHHANSCVGLEHKLEQLTLVKNTVACRESRRAVNG